MLWISLCDSLSISSWGNSTSFRGGGVAERVGGGFGGEGGGVQTRGVKRC